MPDAVRLEAVTAADFAPYIGSAFDVSLPSGEALALTLREVTPLGRDAPADTPRRRPFSLLFDGPVVPPLSQQIYPLRHAALGALDIFLVPVAQTPERREYQAIFS